jgi:hypothetical protein|tara:strand:+ start:1805 stop:2581 length:777 start_codon:yes stop_codon:yes gene_type:complete
MLGLSSASYESGTGKGNIEQASGVQPLVWYAFDEILRNNIFPVNGSEFPSSNSTSALLSKGSSAVPINSNAGTPATDLTSMHRQCIRFDGTDDVVKMAVKQTSTNKAATLMLVFTKTDSGNDVVVSESDSVTEFFVKVTGGDPATTVQVRMGETHNQTKAFPLTNTIPVDQAAVLMLRRNTDGHIFCYTQNKVEEFSNNSNEDVTDMPDWPIKHIGGAAATDMKGVVGEFAMWDEELSEAQCFAVIDSIREKWNLSDL